ncbi:MAG: LytTR family DNA-binding domain-containing protein, partial [Pseudomonadota bacterium]|nr:LytTR family DNA-binding domain-containing protein [Pseudomonadota bacterium]
MPGVASLSTTQVKLLIVDQDAKARVEIAHLCERDDGLEIVAEAASGMAALDAVSRFDPRLLLLNVELPDMTGFDLLGALPSANPPLAIMVTTRADRAVAAYAEGVIDYLIKPVSAERFDKAISRARQQADRNIGRTDGTAHFFSRAGGPQVAAEGHTTVPIFLVGERQRRLYPLDPNTVDYIEADGNYVTLRQGALEYISRDSIKRLSAALADVGYVRIERSLLVNIRAVVYAEMAGHGTFAFTLRSGVCLHSSAAYREAILHILPLPALSKRLRSMA